MVKANSTMVGQVNYALITGGSHGIGQAMAYECAQRGIPVLIVALDNDDLKHTVNTIKEQHQVPVDALGIDLTQANAAKKIYDWCQQKQYQVQFLLNNVGFGRSGYLNSHPLTEYQAMLQLNNQVMVELTYLFLPKLKEQYKAHILNMSSMEATLPLPYKAVYTGTKSFIYSFSLALNEELKESGITVTAICPGPTITNEDGLKRIQAHGNKSSFFIMYPKDVAKPAIDGMLKGRRIVIPGKLNFLTFKLGALVPPFIKMSILEKLFRRYRDE